METRLENGGSIGKSRLDCVIEPRLSQSGKTRYRGRFRSRVFGLVYQKPCVIHPKFTFTPTFIFCGPKCLFFFFLTALLTITHVTYSKLDSQEKKN